MSRARQAEDVFAKQKLEYQLSLSVMLPRFSEARALLGLLNNIRRQCVNSTIKSVYLCTGCPSSQVNWQNPGKWIEYYLDGAEREFAGYVWEESGRKINPRYIKGTHLFLNKHKFLDVDDGVYRVSSAGERFLNQDSCTIREVDKKEGMAEIVRLCAEDRDRKCIFDCWAPYVIGNSRYKSIAAIKELFNHRLKNLAERGVLHRTASTIILL